MKKRISALTACMLALSLLLAGCGAGRKTQDIRNGGADSATAPGEAYEAEAAPRSDAAFYAAVNKTSYDGKSEVEAPSDQSGAADGRKLVKTMAFNIETQDFDKSVADITAMVTLLGGYVENASVSGSSYRKYETRTASYVLRIPVAALAQFEGKIGTVGNVTSRSEQVKDITLKYTDTESRLKSLETQRDSLIEMMAKAEKLEDLLTIQDHLADIQYELENYASTLRLYDNQVEYSSVSVKLTEVKIYTEPQEEPETFGERLAAAFKEGLEDAGNFFKDLVIFLAGSLPALLILAAFIVLIVVLVRKSIKKRRAAKAAAKAGHAVMSGTANDGSTERN